MEKTYLENLYTDIKALVDRSNNDMYTLILGVLSDGYGFIQPQYAETAESFLHTLQNDPALAPDAPVYRTRYIELTDEQRQAYIDSGGGKCPVCPSYEIEGDSFDFEGGTVFQSVSCLTCGATWDDVYQLTNVADVAIQERVS